MYLVWSANMKRDSTAVEEGASDSASDKKDLSPPLTMDQLPEALDHIDFCKMNLMYFEMAAMEETHLLRGERKTCSKQ